MTRRPTAAVRALLPLEATCPPARKPWFWSELGLDPALRDDPDARVPGELLLRAIVLAEQATGDPHVGLRIAAHGGQGRLDVLLHLAAHSRTVGESLARVSRFLRLVNETMALAVEVQRRDAMMVYEPRGVDLAHPGLRSLFELGTATFARQLRTSLGEDRSPTEVRFATVRPAAVDRLEHYFRAPVTFARARTEVRFPAAWLQLPLRNATPELGDMLERFAGTLAARLPAEDASTSERVRAHLVRSFHPDTATLAATARALAVSPRSLQRALAAEHTTFRKVCNEARDMLARLHLEKRNLSIAEVGVMLGFDDTSAFCRAFRRWTGTSPARFRAQVA